ncbi:PAS/PAC sensor signal transduction histidine kinase [Pseudaminobacter salicylatoxidans]|uniref:histidine kinase n=1 Tax=Pseudaminobacter salicylatoxidans TaxID=93369 RepID=A0A316BYQ1_PSESE|nr:PAS domain S-box protein [Pseudaminobacter salicylatoxidans]PWJ79769.1 PAS/PAC sensor signal transduction histidine kinase [Pseudaminobacter salicylatoxidans]
MPSASYSFIDVAILDDVRQRFAAGDALVILSSDLGQVIWANGPGATLFGFADIDSALGEEPGLSFAAQRQIAATSGFPRIGRDRSLMVRLASGLTSQAVMFLASEVALPDGEMAILLAVPAAQGGARGEGEIAARAIGGLEGHGQFAAFVGADGAIEAASEGYGALDIARQTLSELVAEVEMARDRLVKRMIRSGKGLLPAGIARLADEPSRHLLLVIDEEDEEFEEVAPASVEPMLAASEAVVQTPAPDVETEIAEPSAEATSPEVILAEEAQEDILGLEDTDDESDAEETERFAANTVQPSTRGDASQGQHDDWYFSAEEPGEKKETSLTPASDTRAALPERGQTPVRFVWRTDAEGRFSAISDEFARAVGAHAADVIGRKFRDVAMAFGLDPTGEIADLLERRDTWSGRSVLWPLAGTELKIPVDLAALPVYGRERNFEGFRGFGVARRGDAVPDPEKLGLVLVPGSAMPKLEKPVWPLSVETEDTGHDPFQGEVPALTIEPKPDRRYSDKVIRLAEHRPHTVPEKSLSPVERNAFREIGERLKENDSKDTEDAEVIGGKTPADALPAVETEEAGTPSAAEKPVEVPEPAEVDGVEEPTEATAPVDAVTAPTPEAAELPADEEAPAETETIQEAEAEPREASEPAALASEPRDEPHFGAEKLPADTSILEKLPVPVLIHSGDALHYANEEFLTLTGYASVEQLAEAGGLDALFADSYGDDTEAPHHDLRLRTGDGLEFPIQALLRSVPWQGSKALMLVVRRTGDEGEAAVEPAPAMQAPSEAELHARIAEMRTIIDTATDGVVLIDKEGVIRSISRPAEALFGFDGDEVTGTPFASLFAMESQRAVRDYLNGLAEHGVASVLNDGREVIGREAEGRFIPLFMTIGRLPNDSGYCAVVRDITQWKRAEEELTQARALAERSSSQKTEFLARVSHEIRTPLNAIIGFSELMIDEKFGPVANDRYRDYLRDINRSGNHVLDLVNDLLDISKIEAGQQEMAYEAVSLNDTLSETVAMMQPQANRERVIIRSSFASKLPDVVADLRSVRQIALNILSNAVRYTQAGGQVIVSTAYEPSGDIVMRVRDTGIGMTLAEIEQALKPFKQINSLKRPRGDGTGLGLPLTKAMVEANRARFTITSTPGEGTLVEVSFPSTRVLAD